MKKADVFLIIGLFLVGMIAFAWNAASSSRDLSAPKVEIYVNGTIFQRPILPTNEVHRVEIETQYGTNVLLVSLDGVEMIAADCESQDCVHTPKQTVSGGTIACLPHRVLVKLSGNFSSEVDAIAR